MDPFHFSFQLAPQLLRELPRSQEPEVFDPFEERIRPVGSEVESFSHSVLLLLVLQ